MLSQVYLNTNDPDGVPGKRVSVNAPFGEIYNRGSRLSSGSDTYCAINPNANGENQFQCDIFEFNQELEGIPKYTHTMVISHSCGISNSEFIQAIPIYLESELDDTEIVQLKGSSASNPKAALNNWFTNENIRFLGLPAININGADVDRLLGSICHIHSMRQKDLPANPKIRLTYRALSYFQMRIGHFFFRDVQDSDESRLL